MCKHVMIVIYKLFTQTCKMTDLNEIAHPPPFLNMFIYIWKKSTGIALLSASESFQILHFPSHGQLSIWPNFMFHLFLSLYYQVVSLTEYHRRIDALNSEDLRSLCKRLQVPCSALSAPSTQPCCPHQHGILWYRLSSTCFSYFI